jgi:DNA-binding MarR family transcriptional regulator
MGKSGVYIPNSLLVRKLSANGSSLDSDIESDVVELAVSNRRIRSTLKAGTFFQGMANGFLIAAQKGLTQQEYRVLFGCIANMTYGNWIDVPQRIIADEIGVAQSAVGRAMKSLSEKGLLIKGTAPSGRKAYRVNAAIAWMGRTNSKAEYHQVYKNDAALLENPAAIIEIDIKQN